MKSTPWALQQSQPQVHHALNVGLLLRNWKSQKVDIATFTGAPLRIPWVEPLGKIIHHAKRNSLWPSWHHMVLFTQIVASLP